VQLSFPGSLEKLYYSVQLSFLGSREEHYDSWPSPNFFSRYESNIAL
jgi:hypothetical protein